MISGIGNSFPVLPQGPRDPAEAVPDLKRETLQGQNGRDSERQVAPAADLNAPEQGSSLQAQTRRVDALREAEETRFRRQREEYELPLVNQQAVQLYQSNQSTLSQDRDAGELVGIDVFV